MNDTEDVQDRTIQLKKLSQHLSPSSATETHATFSNPNSNLRYQLGAVLGKGGNATIVEATDKDLLRPVAVKLLKSRFHDNARAVRRFVNEARITSKLQHPGVVPVYDIGFLGEGNYFFAMKKVEGETLRDLLNTDTRPSLDELLSCFRTVTQTMAFAHDNNIAHRDLKPENIMVEKYGSTLLMDWGIAKDLNNPDYEDPFKEIDKELEGKIASENPEEEENLALTQLGEITGTPAYMSPEQCLGMMKRMDTRSDIFSLGTILYEILTGHNPFIRSSDDNYRKIFHAIKNLAVTSPARCKGKRKVAIELQAICLKCLEKIPEDRYQSAGELLNDLNNHFNNRPVVAYSTSIQTNISKWCLRHMRYLIASLLIFSSAMVFLYLQKNADRQFSNYIHQSLEKLLTTQANIDKLDLRIPKLSGHAKVITSKRQQSMRSDFLSQWQAAKSSLLYVAENRTVSLPEEELATLKNLWIKEIETLIQSGKLPEAESSLINFQRLVELNIFRPSASEQKRLTDSSGFLGREK